MGQQVDEASPDRTLRGVVTPGGQDDESTYSFLPRRVLRDATVEVRPVVLVDVVAIHLQELPVRVRDDVLREIADRIVVASLVRPPGRVVASLPLRSGRGGGVGFLRRCSRS